MRWLVACLLCAVVDQATFYDDADDDFDEAYEEDDFFTSPMIVSRDSARRRRSDVTNSLDPNGTTSEYDDTEADFNEPKPFLPLTMLPVSPDQKGFDKRSFFNLDSPKKSNKPNIDRDYLKSLTKSGKANNPIYLYPGYKRTSGSGRLIPMDFPIRSSNPINDLNAYSDTWRSNTPDKDINAYPDLPTAYPKSKTELNINPNFLKTSVRHTNDLTIYPDVPTRSNNPNANLSAINYPTQSLYPVTDISTNLNSSPSSDTTTETISTMSTFTTADFVNVSSSDSLILLSPVGFPLSHFAYSTECEDSENTTLEPLRGNNMEQYVEQAPPPPIPVNVPMLLQIIDNLTMNYDWNLTRRFNESLQRFGIPTCETWTTASVTTETPTTDMFENARLVSKCFVCGLQTRGIPRDSKCADAFAGDFIPLVPVDAKARWSISKFRKYCRYLDVNGVVETPSEPLSVFGRFTGGCSVRWVDVTGVYTQRACRNRRRAVTGNHFGSKRMAKLEMALKDVENGCIISPAATLLPLSRAISLYARFHACVCTGSWCNRAEEIPTWMTIFTILSLLMTLKFLT